MKRVLLSIVGTVAGIVALLTFKSQGHPLRTSDALPSASLPTTTPTTEPASPSSADAVPHRSGTGSTSAPATTRTFAGQAIQTQYGIVQVQVTVTGSRIDNVSFLQLQAFDGRSQQINTAAAPILLQETISAQSAQIDAVSGASFTSEGYVQSLQSALDKAGIQ